MSRSDPFPRFCRRIVLRRLALADLIDFQGYRQDPQVGRFQGWTPLPDAEASAFLGEMNEAVPFQPGRWFQIGVSDPDSNRLIGDIGLLVAVGQEHAEIGFTLSSGFQGRGLATEAVGVAIKLLFERTKVARVIDTTDARNLLSIRLLQRVGMTRVETVTAVFRGESCVEQVFSLSRPISG